MTPVELAVVFCAAGAVFAFGVATVGLFRLPDLYARAHATSKGDTLGTLFAVAGAGLALGVGESTGKLLALLVFVFVTTPTATHAIVRTAALDGQEPWGVGDGDGDGSSGNGAGDHRSTPDTGAPPTGDDRP